MSGRVGPRGPWYRVNVSLLALAFAAAVFAGCVAPEELDVEDPAPPADGETFERDGRDLKRELRADDDIGVPKWEVGQFFGVHFFFMDPDFTADWHFDIIVVNETQEHYATATPNEGVAKEHAMFDYPGLGEVRKSDLAFTGIGTSWDWMYEFPLTDGKEWTRDVALMEFTSEEPQIRRVTFTTTYAPSIYTTNGDRPGFEIEGRFDDGGLFITYDFVPEVEWFAHMWMYNETGDPFIHIMSMGFGTGWTGTYYQYTGEMLLQHMQVVSPFVVPPVLDPHQTFNVAEDADYVTGMLFAGAFIGAQTVVIVDPENNHHETVVYSEPDPANPMIFGFGNHFEFFEYDAVAGEWRFLSAGAGAAAISFAMIFQLWGEEHALAAVAGSGDGL
jgi:hypothetical protein